MGRLMLHVQNPSGVVFRRGACSKLAIQCLIHYHLFLRSNGSPKIQIDHLVHWNLSNDMKWKGALSPCKRNKAPSHRQQLAGNLYVTARLVLKPNKVLGACHNQRSFLSFHPILLHGFSAVTVVSIYGWPIAHCRPSNSIRVPPSIAVNHSLL